MSKYPMSTAEADRLENERRRARREAPSAAAPEPQGELITSVYDLVAALGTPGYGGVPSSPGSALKVESLDAVMKSVTFDVSHIKLAKNPKIFNVDYATIPILGSTAVLNRDAIHAAMAAMVEYQGYEDTIVVSPDLLDRAERVLANTVLPNGRIVPAGSYMVPKKLVTCGRCGRLEGSCNCYDVEAGPVAVAVTPKTAADLVAAYKPTSSEEQAIKRLNPLTVVKGRCYMCYHPTRESAVHSVSGIRYCIPCAVEHLRPQT